MDTVQEGWTETSDADAVEQQLRALEDLQHGSPPEAPPTFGELMVDAKKLEDGQIDLVSALLANCHHCSPIELDSLLRAIKDRTGIALGTLKAQIANPGGAKSEPDHLDLARGTVADIGAANLIGRNSQVWIWDGLGVWKNCPDRTIRQRVQNGLDAMPNVAVTNGLVQSVTEVLKNEIYTADHTFNLGHPEAVNCLNGQVAIEAGELRLMAHNREEYRTSQIPVEFDPKAEAPQFVRFLHDIFSGDADKQEKMTALLELFGYTLMAHAKHEKFALLIGKGANGKSVLLKALMALIGPLNLAGVQPSAFSNTFQRAYLDQKLANIVTELKQGEVIADAELKSITSGEPTTVEHKHQSPFTMQPFATCWFGTNHLPHTRDFSPALFRRATIFEFNRVFAPDEQDPMLSERLASETSGVLNLALNAYAKALVHGFTVPASSESAKAAWRLEADQVARFVEDACEKGCNNSVAAGELYNAYRNWAVNSGVRQTVSRDAMLNRLENLGFGRRRTNAARLVTGLKLPPNYGQ